MPKATARTRAWPLPARPVLFFRGEPQSQDFIAGAFAMRDLLASIENAEFLGIGTKYDELELAARFTDQFVGLFDGGPDARRGAAAALAHRLVIAKAGMDLEKWTPLEREPVYSEVANKDHYEPPANSAYFAVDGKPVSVGPELVAYAWRGSEWEKTPIELVRSIGKPITERRFQAMRQQLAAVD
jgi:hypothetical protein